MPLNPRLSVTPARAWICLGLCLLALSAGCGIHVDPGPNPARLLVKAQGAVTTDMVEEAILKRSRLVYGRALGSGEEVSGPLWDLRAFLPQADGQLIPLKPLRPVYNQEGYDFAATAEFLAPAGRYPVVFLLECSVRHLVLESPQPAVHYVYLITQRRQQTLEFCPGCQVEVSPFPQP